MSGPPLTGMAAWSAWGADQAVFLELNESLQLLIWCGGTTLRRRP